MKKTKLLTIASAILVMISVSCKKYEEGPSLSLRGKKARVANEWKVEYAYDLGDGVEVTPDYFGETWEFAKKGEWIERNNGVIDKSGTWEFISDKESLRITKPNGNTYHYDILKLKEKEMWLIDQDEEIHLVPAE